jgi:uncharacterized membrane protein YphA (DoxX/SURF4 family)
VNRKIAIEVICFLFIFLFVYAAVSKLADYQKFVVQLGQSPMLTRWAGFAAWFVPVIEIVISIMLVFAATQKAALYAALNLMIVFTAYIIIVTNYSPHVPCSCGGVLERLNWTEHLAFNVGFILLAIIAIVLHDAVHENSLTEAEPFRDQSFTTRNL